MTKKLPLTIVLFYSVFQFAMGQQSYPYYTQYYANPYIINPAFVASSSRPEVNISYRQQWAGVENSPKTMQGDFQYPINNKMALGVNIINDRSILLSQFTMLATFGYKVQFTNTHVLGFGLSGGLLANQLQLGDVPNIDINDPVLQNGNSMNFDGQFGVHYKIKKFNVGFSLLKLVNNNPFNSKESTEFSAFKDYAVFVNYKFNLSPAIIFDPYIMYRSTINDFNYYEATGLFQYKNFLTIGGGYRSETGPFAMIRFKINKGQFGYSYDFPNSKYGGSTGGTHEAQLKWMFGSDPIIAQEEPEPEDEETIEDEPVQLAEVKEPEPKQEQAPVEEKPVVQPPVTVTPEQPVVAENKPEPQEREVIKNPTWYLIVGTFNKQSNANRLVKQMADLNIVAEIKQINGEGFYYVHIPKYGTNAITVDLVLEIRKMTPFKDAWYKKLD